MKNTFFHGEYACVFKVVGDCHISPLVSDNQHHQKCIVIKPPINVFAFFISTTLIDIFHMPLYSSSSKETFA